MNIKRISVKETGDRNEGGESGASTLAGENPSKLQRQQRKWISLFGEEANPATPPVFIGQRHRISSHFSQRWTPNSNLKRWKWNPSPAPNQLYRYTRPLLIEKDIPLESLQNIIAFLEDSDIQTLMRISKYMNAVASREVKQIDVEKIEHFEGALVSLQKTEWNALLNLSHRLTNEDFKKLPPNIRFLGLTTEWSSIQDRESLSPAELCVLIRKRLPNIEKLELVFEKDPNSTEALPPVKAIDICRFEKLKSLALSYHLSPPGREAFLPFLPEIMAAAQGAEKFKLSARKQQLKLESIELPILKGLKFLEVNVGKIFSESFGKIGIIAPDLERLQVTAGHREVVLQDVNWPTFENLSCLKLRNLWVAPALFSVFAAKMPELVDLKTDIRVGAERAPAKLKIASRFEKLKSFELTYQAGSFGFLADIMSSMPNLNHFELGVMGELTLTADLNLPRLEQLEVLEVRTKQISSESFSTIGKSAPNLKRLKVTVSGQADITETVELPLLKELDSLKLEGLGFFPQFFEKLPVSAPNLTNLKITICTDDEHAATESIAKSRFEKLESLALDYRLRSFPPLSEMMAKTPNLSHFEIATERDLAITEDLTLPRLDNLSSLKVGYGASTGLFKVIGASAPNVEKLDLSEWANLSKEELLPLIEQMPQFEKLTSLILPRGFKLSDDDIEKLKETLKGVEIKSF